MIGMQTGTALRARAMLDGTDSQDGADIARVEKQLAREGDRALARELHGHRMRVDETRAYEILSGTGLTVPETLKLAKRLASDKRIGLARRLLRIAREGLRRSDFPDIYVEIFQKSALYTYKDPDLPVDWRLDSGARDPAGGRRSRDDGEPRVAWHRGCHLQAQMGSGLRASSSRARVVLLPARVLAGSPAGSPEPRPPIPPGRSRLCAASQSRPRLHWDQCRLHPRSARAPGRGGSRREPGWYLTMPGSAATARG